MPETTPAPPASSTAPPAVSSAGLAAGAARALPIATGIFVYGVVFGVLAHQTGLTLAEAALMSAVVYAGASQFTALGLWQVPVPALPIIITTLVVNLRHLMMSASMHPWIGRPRRRSLFGLLFFLTDESWALSIGEFARNGGSLRFFVGAALTLFVTWQLATATGYVAGNVVQDPVALGLDFAFVAVFTVLLVCLCRGRRDLLPWAVAAAAAIGASLALPGNWYIIVGGLAGSLAAAARDGR